MKNIPFSLPKVYEGFAKAEGVAHYDGDSFWLEFQIRDGLMGLLKSEVKQVPLLAEDLEAVHLKHRMFRSHLTLRARSLEAVEILPGCRGAEVRLRFERQYRAEVEEILSGLALAISEARLSRLYDEDGLLDE